MTDTELQIAQFVLPKHGFGITNETVEARTLRAFKEELSEDHVSNDKITDLSNRIDLYAQWFPMEYYGKGKNSHEYHVFGT